MPSPSVSFSSALQGSVLSKYALFLSNRQLFELYNISNEYGSLSLSSSGLLSLLSLSVQPVMSTDAPARVSKHLSQEPISKILSPSLSSTVNGTVHALVLPASSAIK